MVSRKKRHPGAQPGNQNARKHGYYSKILSPEELALLPACFQAQDIDNEIALLRITLASLRKYSTDKPELIFRTANYLRRMVDLRHHISSQDGPRTRNLYRSFVQWLNQNQLSASAAAPGVPENEAGRFSSPAKTNRASSSGSRLHRFLKNQDNTGGNGAP